MSNITFSEYQQRTADTAVYPGVNGRVVINEPIDAETTQGLCYVAFGLLGELGEIGEKIKKVIRDKDGVFTEGDIQSLQSETGDAAWYFAQLATKLGIDLGDAASGNLEKLADRKRRGVLGGSGDNR